MRYQEDYRWHCRAPVTAEETKGERKGMEIARGQVVDGGTSQATPTLQMTRQAEKGVLEAWKAPQRAQRRHHKPRGYSSWETFSGTRASGGEGGGFRRGEGVSRAFLRHEALLQIGNDTYGKLVGDVHL